MGDIHEASKHTVSRWEFPIPAKYEFGGNTFKPFIGLGSVDTLQP